MIAYVFWHWPEAGAGRSEYEAAQREFHAELNRASCDGFQRSVGYRVRGAPWIPGGEGYEDWYLLDGSHALDPLNEVAVSARLRQAHDAAARSATGAGGLYRLVIGVPPLASGTVFWLRKERGEPYDDFYAKLGREAAVWRRQMVLGPALEFLCEGDRPPVGDATAVERELYAP